MLTVKRPTPTTIQYTVSTRSPVTTLASRLITWLLLALRLITGTLVSLSLVHEYQNSAFWSSGVLKYVPKVAILDSLLPGLPNLYLRLLVCFAFAFLVLRKSYTSESLLLIQGLGVQISSSSSSCLWSGTTRFIPTSEIQDVFVHEAFKGFEIKFYLSVVTTAAESGEGGGEVVVVFPNILPRRQILEEVWRGVRAGLYEGKT